MSDSIRASAVIACGVKRRMADEGPLHETPGVTPDGDTIFMTMGNATPLRETTVYELAAARVLTIEGRKPNRVAYLLN